MGKYTDQAKLAAGRDYCSGESGVQLQLFCRVRVKKYRSYKGQLGHIAPNDLARQFHADRPNEKWVTDVTEFNVDGRKLYLSPVLDLFNGEIVSYEMSPRPLFGMVGAMLKKAFSRLKSGDRPMLHSDQGWQGGFNRSSQHEIVEQILGARPELRPVSSSQASAGAWYSVQWRQPGSLEHSNGISRCPLESIAVEGRSYSHLCHAAMDCAGRRRIPSRRHLV